MGSVVGTSASPIRASIKSWPSPVPAEHTTGRPAVQLAAASAALAITLENGSLVQRGIVVCSAGTGDGQDLMLARIGLAEVPTTEPIECDEFKDHVRVMYCSNTQQLNPRFLRIMDEMAKTIGITRRDCLRALGSDFMEQL